MFKWSINYYNYQNQRGATFTVKASDKTQAIKKAVEQIQKKFFVNDRYLNNYKITLRG